MGTGGQEAGPRRGQGGGLGLARLCCGPGGGSRRVRPGGGSARRPGGGAAGLGGGVAWLGYQGRARIRRLGGGAAPGRGRAPGARYLRNPSSLPRLQFPSAPSGGSGGGAWLGCRAWQPGGARARARPAGQARTAHGAGAGGGCGRMVIGSVRVRFCSWRSNCSGGVIQSS